MDENKVGVDLDISASVDKHSIDEEDRLFEVLDNETEDKNDTEIKAIKFDKGINKSTIAWLIFYLIGIGFSIYRYFIPVSLEINVTEGIGLKIVLSFVGMCAVKYIWIISLVCIFFTIKRKENPKYFSFIMGFYTLLLILCVIGVFI